eukprot:CAMPEP_0195292640 /NCGR_PEP_ID=MMETSP0707-20130614/10369_1 /TAXON_ID=33640 /ORGANISM="Asterionellopsis glacialis, Strain CCMP134" /LENGTH=203 /DNA_ID=CAMNT_0040353157 /DNA_START=14 /DNA_END=622 /DNA_ORIENTATION=-
MENRHQRSSRHGEQISNLINYAQTSYEENPTEALSALMHALTLNGGQASADRAMQRLRTELGPEIADHVSDRNLRMERAFAIVEEMLRDESTFLYQRGKQDILRQAMEDGSSLVCTKCNSMVAASRWQQHQQYWCPSISSSSSSAGAATTEESCMEDETIEEDATTTPNHPHGIETKSSDSILCTKCNAVVSASRWQQHQQYW